MDGSRNAAFIGADNPVFAEIVQRVARVCPYKLPLYRAVASRQLHLVMIFRGADYPATLIKLLPEPAVVLIGDDDYAASGPSGFQDIRRIRYWPRRTVIHAAGGTEAQYNTFVLGATQFRRMLLIETDTAHEEEWVYLMDCYAPILLVSARNDGGHPIVPVRH